MRRLALLPILGIFVACGDIIAPTAPMDAPAPSLDIVLPPGSGIQKFVAGRSGTACAVYCTGRYAPIPFFSPEEIVVQSGTWVTLGFGLLQTEWGPQEPTPEDVLARAREYLEDDEIEITLGGESIEPVADYLRSEGLTITPLFASTGEVEDFRTIVLWRYFVHPQSADTYVYTFRNLADGFFERDLTWLPDDEEEVEVEIEVEVDGN